MYFIQMWLHHKASGSSFSNCYCHCWCINITLNFPFHLTTILKCLYIYTNHQHQSIYTGQYFFNTLSISKGYNGGLFWSGRFNNLLNNVKTKILLQIKISGGGEGGQRLIIK